MSTIGNFLIILGILILGIGILFSIFPKAGLPRLPGDILIQKDNFTFYFPIATSILLSIILTIILRIFNK